MLLHIKKKWLDMILKGEKKEEYREIKPYYDVRFKKWFGEEKVAPVYLRNGYSSSSRTVCLLCSLKKGTGKEEWGAEKNKEYYVLEILSIINSNVKKLPKREKE